MGCTFTSVKSFKELKFYQVLRSRLSRVYDDVLWLKESWDDHSHVPCQGVHR